MAYNGNADYGESTAKLQVLIGVIQALKRAKKRNRRLHVILISFPELEFGVEIPQYNTD